MSGKWKTALALGAVAGLAILVLRGWKTPPVSGGWPVNIGHRGASVRFPENTLRSFRAAVEAGAGGLELDVRLTRDRHPVVMHDPTVDRTTDGSGAVAGMTLADVRRLDAGGSGRPDERVPTLREVLAAFPDAQTNIDIKDERVPGVDAVVLGVVREAGAMGRVLVVSAHHRVLRRFRRLDRGDCDTGASRLEIGVFYGLSLLRLERLLRPAFAALQVPVNYGSLRIITPRFVQAAHSRGVRVDAWTINDPEQMRVLLDLGVDSVMTDDPETLAKVLEGRTLG